MQTLRFRLTSVQVTSLEGGVSRNPEGAELTMSDTSPSPKAQSLVARYGPPEIGCNHCFTTIHALSAEDSNEIGNPEQPGGDLYWAMGNDTFFVSVLADPARPASALFKFFKHKGGLSAFAAITLEQQAGSEGGVEWMSQIKSFEPTYGEAVASGVRDAIAWHTQEGGTSTAFLVLEFEELLVDTKPDAVRCAATMAAWKALGHDESSISFEFEREWVARRYSPPPTPDSPPSTPRG